MAVVRSAPALGTYIGNGSKDGNEVSFTLRLNDRKFFWLDYKSRGLTDAESVSWHSEGAYQLVAGEDSYSQTVRCEIGGLPGQARVGQVYDFEVKEGGAGAKVLVCQGINCQPQADTQDSAPRHLCEKCGKDVVGQVLKVGGMYFHPDCFTCDTCNKSLTGAFHKQPDGKKLCADCVPKAFCEACKKVISGGVTKVGGKTFHRECFKCDACSTALSGGFLTQTKGDVVHRFCDKDCVAKGPSSTPAVEKPAETAASTASSPAAERTCVKCSKGIEGSYVLGDKEDIFHEECFVCTECNCKLQQFAVGKERKFKYQKARYLCIPCSSKEVEVPEETVDTRPCCVCKVAVASSTFLEMLDGYVIHKSCFKCKSCGQEPPMARDQEVSKMKLLRCKVTSCIEGTYECDDCMALRQGCYVGKRMADGTETSYQVRLMADERCWFDCTTKTQIASGSWHVEGSIVRNRGSDGSDLKSITFTVDTRPLNGGPEVGKVYEFEVLKSDGAAVLVCEGVQCKHSDVPEMSLEDTLPSKPKAAGGYTAASPAPAPAPAAAPAAAAVPPAAATMPPGAAAAAPTFTLTLDELKNTDVWKAKGVDPGKREEYLADDVFVATLGVSKADFAKQPKWKRDNKKKEIGLY